MIKVGTSNAESRKQAKINTPSSMAISADQLLVDIKMLSFMINISERTIFRLIKESSFPRVKVRRSLLFDPHEVLRYLKDQYGGNSL